MSGRLSGKVVLVCGASSGIGLACARLLVDNGCVVYGACRRPMDGHGIRWLAMDITDPDSVRAAVDAVISEAGALDVVVQSAGMGVAGAIEDLSPDEVAAQMGPNFYGTLNLVKAALPFMRERKSGLFVQIGSMAGLITIPFQGYYSASKYALEAVIEALRLECRPLGVRACLIEPGDTRTAFTAARVFCENPGKDYERAMRHAVGVMENDERKGVPPEKVARTVLRLIKRRRPPVRVAVGLDYKLLLLAKRLLPSAMVEWMLRMKYLRGK